MKINWKSTDIWVAVFIVVFVFYSLAGSIFHSSYNPHARLEANARAGYAPAQEKLGDLYYRGVQGFETNDEEAYFWYSLATMAKPEAAAARDSAAKQLTAEQKATVDKRVREWLKDHRAPIAAYPPQAM